jgi:hypothetical protein
VLHFYGLRELEPSTYAEPTVALGVLAAPLAPLAADGKGAGGGDAGAAAEDDTDHGERQDLLSLHPTSVTAGARRVAAAVAADAGAGPRLDPTDPLFDPDTYLAAHYGSVAFADLERGMRALHTRVDQRTESLRALVRNNLDRFMKSKDTIDHIRPSAPSRPTRTQSYMHKHWRMHIEREKERLIYTIPAPRRMHGRKLCPRIGICTRGRS